MVSSASLEIHVMNVGQGDAVLVINRDLGMVRAAITKGSGTVPPDPIDYVPYAIKNNVDLQAAIDQKKPTALKMISLVGTVKNALLVDGGDDEYGGDVLNYMTDHGVLDGKNAWTPKLSVVVSHYHDDHMAGLRSVFKKRIDPTKKGEKVKLVERLRPGAVYQSFPETKTNPPSQRFIDFQDDVQTASVGKKNEQTARRYVYPGGLNEAGKTMTISLGTGVNGIPITVYILASGQAVWNAAKKQIVKIASTGAEVDQNDRSVVLVLEYGSFRCLLGGDIAGNGGPVGGNTGANAADSGNKRFFSQHADVESKLGPALEVFFPATTKPSKGTATYPAAGYCTVLKANHHASSSSVDVYFLATVQPLLFVTSSGVKARWHNHPTQAVLNRTSSVKTPNWGLRPTGNKTVKNTIVQTYFTEVAQKVSKKNFGVAIYTGRIVGDTVIRPVDETIAAIQDATVRGTQLTVQVYGIGLQTELANPDTTLRPTVAVSATSKYPIGPFTHFDTH